MIEEYEVMQRHNQRFLRRGVFYHLDNEPHNIYIKLKLVGTRTS